MARWTGRPCFDQWCPNHNVTIQVHESSHLITCCNAWQHCHAQRAKFMGPTWGPSGSCWPQMGSMLAPWTLLSGHWLVHSCLLHCLAMGVMAILLSSFTSKNLNKANLRDLIAATGLAISNWIQIVNFSARVTVKFDGWPCKTIGQLFYATSSFVHHFVPIGEFKLKLQSGNTQSGSNWMIFRAVRPWNLTDDLAIK